MLARSIDVQAYARCEGKRAESEAEANCDGEKRRSGSGKGKGKIEAKKRPETRRQGSLWDLVALCLRHGRFWLQNLLYATVLCPRSSPVSCRPSLMAMKAILVLVRWSQESAGLDGGRV